MTLGENIKHLREERGMSLEDFAAKLGVAPYKVYIWENGTAKPDAAKLMEIADFFGVSYDELMSDGFTEPTEQSYTAPVPTPKKEKKKSTLYNVFIVIFALLAVIAIPAAMVMVAFMIDGTVSAVWPVLLCCLPPIICLVYGIIGQCKGYIGLINIIVGAVALLICMFICTGAGFVRRLEPTFDYDLDFIAITEEKTGLDLSAFKNPHGWRYIGWDGDEILSDKDITNPFDGSAVCYDGSIIYYEFSADLPEYAEEAFIASIEENGSWLKGIPTQLTGLAPTFDLDYDAEYLLILNEDTGEFNTYPEKSGVSHFICLTYDTDYNILECVEYEKHINLG